LPTIPDLRCASSGMTRLFVRKQKGRHEAGLII
jgi:hypothetical protein